LSLLEGGGEDLPSWYGGGSTGRAEGMPAHAVLIRVSPDQSAGEWSTNGKRTVRWSGRGQRNTPRTGCRMAGWALALRDEGVHLDLDAVAGVDEPGLDHRGGGRVGPESGGEERPAGLEVLAAGQDVADADDLGEGGSGLVQGGLDGAEREGALVLDGVGDGHGHRIGAGGAGDEDPRRRDHGAAVADAGLVGGGGGDASDHGAALAQGQLESEPACKQTAVRKLSLGTYVALVGGQSHALNHD